MDFEGTVMKLRNGWVMCAMGLLAACGGSGSPYIADNAAFLPVSDVVTSVGDQLNDLEPTEFNQTPAGSGSFAGYAIAVEGAFAEEDAIPTFVAIGTAEITVDFGTQAVDGTAGEFFELDPVDVAANWNETDDDFDPAELGTTAIEGSFDFDPSNRSVSGELVKADGDTVSYSLVVRDVELLGPTAEAVEVTATGTSTSGSGDATDAGLFVGAVR